MQTQIIMAAAAEINYRGFKFTMSDLTKRLCIGKSSLYEHFSSKSELVAAVIDKAIEDIQEQEDSIYNNSELSIEQKFQALTAVRPKLFGPISDRIYDDLRNDSPEGRKVAEFRKTRMDRLMALLEQGIESKVVRPINLRVVRQLFFGAMNDLFDYHFLAENNMTYPDAIAAMSDLMVYGMSPNNT